jgi:hypothetical protein
MSVSKPKKTPKPMADPKKMMNFLLTGKKTKVKK